MKRDFDAAATTAAPPEHIERALALAPQQAFMHSACGAHLYMRGETEPAGSESELAMARGGAAAAIAIYADLCRALPDNPGCFACLAGAQAAAGQRELAEATLADLHARFAERDPSALEIPVDVSYRALQGDRRWAPLAARVRSAPPRRIATR